MRWRELSLLGSQSARAGMWGKSMSCTGPEAGLCWHVQRTERRARGRAERWREREAVSQIMRGLVDHCEIFLAFILPEIRYLWGFGAEHWPYLTVTLGGSCWLLCWEENEGDKGWSRHDSHESIASRQVRDDLESDRRQRSNSACFEGRTERICWGVRCEK